MGNRLLRLGRSRAGRRRTIVMAGGVGLSVLLSLAPAAFAETYTVPNPTWPGHYFVGLGTSGDDAPGSVALSHGGCARDSGTAVAIGESNRRCDDGNYWFNGTWEEQSEANGSNTAVGLLGADAHSWGVAVASDGDAYAECAGSVEPFCWTTAISGTGGAYGPIAISGTGPATTRYKHYDHEPEAHGPYIGVAASGTGDASAHSPYGPAGIAVSGTGNANGSTLGVSVLGTVNELLP